MESFADSMHVLGLEDCPDGNQNLVYEEFKEQLVRSPKGWYVSCLLWKVTIHPYLTTSMEFEALGQHDEKIGEAAMRVAKM